MSKKDRIKVLLEFILHVVAGYLKVFGRDQGNNGRENHV